MTPTHRDYCQFLIVTQTNYTQTYFADHHPTFSHDAINRHLRDGLVSPALVWAQIKDTIAYSENGYLVFDDSVSDKRHSSAMELVRRQYSGNAHAVIKGIGVVNCVYVNPDSGEHWIIDWRVYNPDDDGKTKLHHLMDMFDNAIHHKKLSFRTVLMDVWYATKDVMLHIDRAKKVFYCPLKGNRQVDGSGNTEPYRAVSELSWTAQEMDQGKLVKIKGFPGDYKVKLFRVAVTTHRTDWVVTNDLSQASAKDTREKCALRWKIEQYHRDVKQTLGIEKCQCRLARAQKNHIGHVILAWNQFTLFAREMKTNIYALKQNLLAEYMRAQLKSPSIAMVWR